MKIPCEECPLIPICRHKTIGQLFGKCQPVQTFMMESNVISKTARLKHRTSLVRTLRPTKWKLNKKGYCFVPQKRREITINGIHRGARNKSNH
jgi:hypothetical protein